MPRRAQCQENQYVCPLPKSKAFFPPPCTVHSDKTFGCCVKSKQVSQRFKMFHYYQQRQRRLVLFSACEFVCVCVIMAKCGPRDCGFECFVRCHIGVVLRHLFFNFRVRKWNIYSLHNPVEIHILFFCCNKVIAANSVAHVGSKTKNGSQ